MKRKVRKSFRIKRVRLPRKLLQAFAVVAIILVPWTAWLSYSLPSDHLDQRWNLAWTGFDIALLVSLAMTAYLGLRKSGWVTVTATMAGTLLIVDAWFDCLTAKDAWEHLLSLEAAIFIEIPLALLAFWIAYRAGKQFFSAK
jgi:hypothetical protein